MKLALVDFTCNINGFEFNYLEELNNKLGSLGLEVIVKKPNFDWVSADPQAAANINFNDFYLSYVAEINLEIEDADWVAICCHGNSQGAFDFFSLEKANITSIYNNLAFADSLLNLANKNLLLLICEGFNASSQSVLGISYNGTLSALDKYILSSLKNISNLERDIDFELIYKFFENLQTQEERSAFDAARNYFTLPNAVIEKWYLNNPSEMLEFESE